MFKIFVKNLKLYGYHGVRELEKKDGQYFLFNIEVLIEGSDYSGRDKLENTLSYSDVIREVKRINKTEKYELLETFSQVLANRVIEMSCLVREVSIRIEKPSPPIDEKLDTVGVEYVLSKDECRPVNVRKLKPGNAENSKTGDSNIVYLSLGSNMGNRKINLKKALKLLKDNPDVCIENISSLYETEPMYIKDQKSFYNIVVKAGIESKVGPFEFLGSIKAIEYRLGRKKAGTRYGPRLIDIDILYFGDEVIESEILEIPHPKIVERKFVLLPLSEIAPDIKIGRSDLKTYIKKTHLPEKVKVISTFDLS